MKPLLLLIIFLIPIFSVRAASLGVNEVFVRLQGALENEAGLKDLISDLDALEGQELRTLLKEFDPTWRTLKGQYLQAHKEYLETALAGEARQEAKAQIRRHREDFMLVYQKDEVAMKPLLKSKSMPALENLRRLIMPSAEELLKAAPPALLKKRKMVLVLAKFRDAIVDAAILTDDEKAMASILEEERIALTRHQDLPRDGLRVLQENEEIAEKEQIPVEEQEGIRELNEWRLLLGLNALMIDPKLCEASRGHSKDMNENGFFAHQSPLPGKTTPWDRAARAGTQSSGENIFMGSEKSQSANKGWFYSPGHHKNMFKASHTRIGLGRYQSHWTQMFG